MTLEELKQEYNGLIKRELRAEKWMDTADKEDIKKWMPNYMGITIKLSRLMAEYRKITGKEMSDKEVFKGFDL
ncbi:hypothetical protein [Clostridium luticellarii]|uniref:Uncharacterized protein n=1 Tax=Clostridium luticellarii TaxID=1691940 RepID=A0A2T0BNV8_9CLOT|nr:hypothetical protein [Clostridium luticellarii]PRR85550.1 hypothetical protein CLLU_14710 [Clostridium luticellarii]